MIIFPSSLPSCPVSSVPHRNHSPSNHRGAATQPDAAMYALQGWGGRGEQGEGEGLQSDPLSWEDFTLLFQTESEDFRHKNRRHAKKNSGATMWMGQKAKVRLFHFTRMSSVIQTLMLWPDHMAGLHGSFKVKHRCEVDRRELQNDWTQATPLNECEALTVIRLCLEAERVVLVTSHLSPTTWHWWKMSGILKRGMTAGVSVIKLMTHMCVFTVCECVWFVVSEYCKRTWDDHLKLLR